MRRTLTKFMIVPTAAAAVTLMLGAAVDETPSAANDKPADSTQQIPAEVAAQMAAAMEGGRAKEAADELPKFADVAKDYVQVVSTTDGESSLYTIWTRAKDQQMLAELPRNFEGQKLFIAYTIAGGIETAGVQFGDMYAYWKRFDKRLALIQPNLAVRTTGDAESQKGRDRVFTDRVILDVPIVAMGMGGGPVIDMDALLLGQSSTFFGYATAGANTGLATIAKAKAYPRNVELGFELPLSGGRLGTLYYSISAIPETPGYQPRVADPRIGYFTTTYMDIGNPAADIPWTRYVNRWHLEKADPNLKLSPPKQPIVFYLEHTIPVRYRRWVRDGVLEWNKAFEKVGIVNAVEVYQQDAKTGAHMDKDPEDARYNFVLWTNANMGFAIGPSRVNPNTGQIIDADIVMDEGFITSWSRAWKTVIPQTAMETFGPETFAWLATKPQWDPRVRMASPAERPAVTQQLAMAYAQRGVHRFGMHPAMSADPTLVGDDAYDGLGGRVSQVNGACMQAMAKSLDVAMFRLSPSYFLELAAGAEAREGESPAPAGDTLDGVPESFIGPALKDVVMHEVGHTLGLRHNFKASSVYGMSEVNSRERQGMPITGSVMDYTPLNINFGDGPVQGPYTMPTIGPYDYWAIEYGYTAEQDLKPVLAKVAEKELPYATDEDTWGPDPLSRRFDFAANPLDYADSQIRLVGDLRGKILERMVKDGESWEKARDGYEILLGRQFSAVSIAAGWIGGAHVNRDRKGDPGNRNPVEPVSVQQQRRALKFVIDHSFRDASFGLTPELLSKMTVDKWWDDGGMGTLYEDPSYPIHDRIMGLQASALTMVLNPTRLNRVYDNEFRLGDADALTLPEVIFGVSDAVFTELDQPMSGTYSARKPMISSLRRNLQSELVSRLIDLSLPNDGFGACAKPVSNLCVMKMKELSGKIEKALANGGTRLDPYSSAHLQEAKARIDRALEAQYIYNTNDISGGGMPFGMFGKPAPGK